MDTVIVQLVKNVIEQKQWFEPVFFFKQFEFRQFERDEERLLLALASPILQGLVHQLKVEIITMYPN